MEGTAVGFNLGEATAKPVATATIAPQPTGEGAVPVTTVSSSIKGGNVTSTNGDIIVKAIYNQDLSVASSLVLGTGAEATAHASSGSFDGEGTATATAVESPRLDSWIAAGAMLSAKDTISVISSSLTTPSATAAGQGGGFVWQGRATPIPPAVPP